MNSRRNYLVHWPAIQPATSLGGVESLIEQRVASDAKAPPCLVRISVGVEDVEDLKDDLRQAFQAIIHLAGQENL